MNTIGIGNSIMNSSGPLRNPVDDRSQPLETRSLPVDIEHAYGSLDNEEFRKKSKELTFYSNEVLRAEKELKNLKELENHLKENFRFPFTKVFNKLPSNCEFELHRVRGNNQREISAMVPLCTFTASATIMAIFKLPVACIGVGVALSIASFFAYSKYYDGAVVPGKIKKNIEMENKRLEDGKKALESIPKDLVAKASESAKSSAADEENIIDESDFVSVGGIKLNKRKESDRLNFLSYLFPVKPKMNEE